jgi:hypothetical protein
MRDCHGVNATARRQGHRRNQSGFERRQRTDGQRGVLLLSALWTCPASGNQWGLSAKHSFSFSGVWSAEPQPSNRLIGVHDV